MTSLLCIFGLHRYRQVIKGGKYVPIYLITACTRCGLMPPPVTCH